MMPEKIVKIVKETAFYIHPENENHVYINTDELLKKLEEIQIKALVIEAKEHGKKLVSGVNEFLNDQDAESDTDRSWVTENIEELIKEASKLFNLPKNETEVLIKYLLIDSPNDIFKILKTAKFF